MLYIYIYSKTIDQEKYWTFSRSIRCGKISIKIPLSLDDNSERRRLTGTVAQPSNAACGGLRPCAGFLPPHVQDIQVCQNPYLCTSCKDFPISPEAGGLA